MAPEIDPIKCEELALNLVRTTYSLLEQLGDPIVTEESMRKLRLFLENNLPCNIGMRLGEGRLYRGKEEQAQEARERIYDIGDKVEDTKDPFGFYKLLREQISSTIE